MDLFSLEKGKFYLTSNYLVGYVLDKISNLYPVMRLSDTKHKSLIGGTVLYNNETFDNYFRKNKLLEKEFIVTELEDIKIDHNDRGIKVIYVPSLNYEILYHDICSEYITKAGVEPIQTLIADALPFGYDHCIVLKLYDRIVTQDDWIELSKMMEWINDNFEDVDYHIVKLYSNDVYTYSVIQTGYKFYFRNIEEYLVTKLMWKDIIEKCEVKK